MFGIFSGSRKAGRNAKKTYKVLRRAEKRENATLRAERHEANQQSLTSMKVHIETMKTLRESGDQDALRQYMQSMLNKPSE